MKARTVELGKLKLGTGQKLFLIAGPCVIESERHAMKMAERIARVARDLKVPTIFKASYDKANRTSVESFRGPGLRQGLNVLARIKKEFRLPVLTDVHAVEEVSPAAEVCDILQIPASFAARPTCWSPPGVRGPSSTSKRDNSSLPRPCSRPSRKCFPLGTVAFW